MDTQKKKRDIVRLRTFADDFEHARSKKTQITKKSVPEPVVTIPKASEENIHIEEQTTPNNEPVFYDAEDVIVPDTTYEENVATSEEKKRKEKEEVMEIPIAEEVSAFIDTPKNSILSDDSNVKEIQEISDLSSGTIIRDTKRKRFRLIPAMITATQNWFTEKKENYEESKVEKYTVTKAENRVETIKAAVKEQMQAPDEDYDQVAKRLKQVKRNTKKNTLAFKPKESIPDPSWSHTLNEKVVKKSVSSEKIVTPTIKTKSDSEMQSKKAIAQWIGETSEIEAIDKSIKNIPPIKIHAPKDNTDSEVEQSIKKVTPEIPQKQQEIPTTDKTTTPVSQTSVKETQEDYVPTVPTKNTTKQQRVYAPYTPPTKFPFKLLATVIAVAIFLGIGISVIFFNISNDSAKETEVFRIPSLIAAQTQTPIPFSADHISLFNEILSNFSAVEDVVQIYPTTPTENGDRPESSANIVALVAPNAPGSFTRAVTEITFGGVGSQPFIIMKVTNFDVGFSGMLQWERAISADLSPLFGEAVTESFDPYARTDTQVRNAFFKDTVAANYSVRLLVDENGLERIIYAFIDKNTILITTTKDALELLVPLIR